MDNQSSYNRWTWVIAIILALILLWMLFTGRGPSNTCCDASTTAVAPVEEVAPTAPSAVTEACAFSASNTEFTSNEACASLAWLAKSDELKSYLAGDLSVTGDDKSVVLTGAVDTENAKVQKGQELQAFFGPDIAVDNQITVKTAEPVVTPPPAAKLYFETGKTALPNDAEASIAPIIEWLSAHPDSKVVLSGFHDSRGNQKANEDLAYSRAKAAQAALIAGGVDVMRIEFVKPESVDAGDSNEARRVEVSIK